MSRRRRRRVWGCHGSAHGGNRGRAARHQRAPDHAATDRAHPQPAAAAARRSPLATSSSSAGHGARRRRSHESSGCSTPPTTSTTSRSRSACGSSPRWMLANVVLGTYTRAHVGVGTIEYARICSAAGITAGAIGIISYLTKFNLSRGFFVLLFVIGVPLLLLWRWIARRLVHRAHARGHLLTRVLISGSAVHIDEVAACSSASRGWAIASSAPWCRRRRRRPRQPRAACPSSASPATPLRRCGARRPTSSSSPRARSRRRSTSAGSPGTSRATTCRWRSCRASATSRRAA